MFSFLLFLEGSWETILISTIAAIVIYLILLMIPGIGDIVKHITHTITKYILHHLSPHFFLLKKP